MAKQAKNTPDTDDQEPKQYRLTAPHRFYDEDGGMHHWDAGQTVSGDEAAMLIERQAPVEAI